MADEVITATAVKKSTNPLVAVQNVTAGATVTRGMTVVGAGTPIKYQGGVVTDSSLHKISAIALNDADLDQPLQICSIDPEFEPGFTVVVGEIYVLGSGTGGISVEGDLGTGEFSVVIGPGLSSTVLPINFSVSSFGGQVP